MFGDDLDLGTGILQYLPVAIISFFSHPLPQFYISSCGVFMFRICLITCTPACQLTEFKGVCLVYVCDGRKNDTQVE